MSGLTRTVERAGTLCWRLVGIGLVAWVLVLLMARLRAVLLALLAAALLTAVLSPAARFLRQHRWPPALAALAVFAAFFAAVSGLSMLAAPPVADQIRDLGPILADGVDDVKQWVTDNAPGDPTPEQVDAAVRDLAGRTRQALTSGMVVTGAVVLAEAVAGAVLAIVTAFFLVKDGEELQRWALARIPDDRRDDARVLARAAWGGLNGYLRGAAALGAVEGAVMSATLVLVGAGVAVPVGLFTFAAAFVPFAGALVAGGIAVLVTLVTAGGAAALVVLGVAVAVQALDNDVLAPFVYGKTLAVHPLVILLVVAAAAALAGAVGVVVAVPAVAVGANVAAARHKLGRGG